MYFDDYIARQIMQINNPAASHHAGAQRPTRRPLRALWHHIRQVAWGIDAFSRVRHGIDVPPDHRARTRPRCAPHHQRRRALP